ncbi:hypothetical protein I41_40260 [Lacipirellula limnantheis]|uniref:Uncharacterized protein n=1 Tax=Lacipirellula limnantheis TaxID=2528024 RepID=A0A517U2J1_9BACT|nr:hypothetical protein I41_40260 [Lacipirellula limnantheis]
MQAISCSIVVLSGALMCSSATLAGFNPISFILGLGVLIIGLYAWALTCTRPNK